MRLDKKKFSANADPTCRKLITEEHRDALDGKEVVNGQIEYTVNGENYYLFPVLPEWCID